MAAVRTKRAGAVLGIAGLGLATGAFVLAAPALADATITSAGPLTSITITNDLNCAVNHAGDSAGEWFGNTACGTFVAIGDHLYGPASVPAGGGATGSAGYIAFSSITAPVKSGSGTSADPFTVRTVVGLGSSGVRLTETDSYVVGQESYRTSVVLTGGRTATSAIIYRAGDCYLQDSDYGLGEVQNGTAPICKALPGSANPDRIEGLYPLTAGSHYLEDYYATMWAALGSRTSLPDTCRCTEQIDNAAALSWAKALPAGGTAQVDSLTIFSPLGAAPLAFTKTADAATAATSAADGYTVKISNPGATAETLTSITDTLPAGFSYIAGSTTGATTSNPTVAGQTLTYTGSFAVPASAGGTPGSISLHFGVHVADTAGTYTNSVTGEGSGVSVIPANSVAPITVTGPTNGRPTANDDSYTTPEDTPLDVAAPGVLANDTDPESDPLTAVIATQPGHGTVTLNADGSFHYVPNANYNGTDTFTYRAADPTHQSDPATVTITVTPVADPIVANDDSYTTPKDTALHVAAPGVLGNDSNVDHLADPATVQSGPSHGTLTLNTDGSFDYTPEAGYLGPDSFTYRAGDSNVATVHITVAAINHPPTPAADSYSTRENTTLNVQAPGVLGNDSDPDGDTLTAVLGAKPKHGTVTLNADGGFSYVPARGFSGTDSFTYRASDGTLTSPPTTVTITVRPLAVPPPPGGGLASTGTSAQMMLLVSGLLLAVGGALSLAGRRRPRRT